MPKKGTKTFIILLCLSFFLLTSISNNSINVNGWEPTATPVCTADEDQTWNHIAPTSDGGVVIAWADYRDLDWDVYAQKFDSYGNPQWTLDGVQVSTISGLQTYCRPISDGAGGAIIVFRDYSTGSVDLYAQRIDSSGNRLWGVDGVVVCNADDDQASYDLCSDGVGGLIVAFDDERKAVGQYDIYAQRLNQNGVALWGANGTIVCNATGQQRYPEIVTDLSGGAHISWTDGRAGSLDSDRDIYVQRLNSTGVPQWADNGINICNLPNEQGYTQMIGDIFGDAIIAWVDARVDPSYDIYIQKVSKSGTIMWDTNGVAVCTENSYQSQFSICSDNADGAIVAWRDRRDGGLDVYAQRLNVIGTPLWTPNGTAVCTAEGNQYSVQMVADGNFGAIIIWSDERSPSEVAIYTQRIQSDSSVLWGANGTIIDPFPNEDKLWPNLAYINTGAAVITWEDTRNSGNLDIWAQYYLDSTIPICTSPSDDTYQQGSTANITWTLGDNAGGGYYKVEKGVFESIQKTVIVPWTEWDIWDNVDAPIDTSVPGVWTYRITYNDSYGNGGISDLVVITIIERPPPDLGPLIIIVSVAGVGIAAVVVFIMIRRRKPK